MKRVALQECAFAWAPATRSDLFARVTFDLNAGSWTVLRGLSGSGKSTLALICAGLLSPTAGVISFNGDRLPEPGSVQLLFQDPFAAIDPRMTVAQWFSRVVNRAPRSSCDWARWQPSNEAMPDEVAGIFDRVALRHDTWHSAPLELSGGECQRVNLAAALMAVPTVLILDEPFTMVDIGTQLHMVELIRRYAQEQTAAVLLIHHGPLPSGTPVDQMLELSEGQIRTLR